MGRRPAGSAPGRRETCLKGELAEIEFLRRATQLGYVVCKPFGNSARFDFLVWAPGQLKTTEDTGDTEVRGSGGAGHRVIGTSGEQESNAVSGLTKHQSVRRTGGRGKATKVQVKSAWEQSRATRGYVVRLWHAKDGGSGSYRPEEVDVIAAYVEPHDAWYLVPLQDLGKGACLALFPQNRESKHEKYRERWEVLGGGQRQVSKFQGFKEPASSL